MGYLLLFFWLIIMFFLHNLSLLFGLGKYSRTQIKSDISSPNQTNDDDESKLYHMNEEEQQEEEEVCQHNLSLVGEGEVIIEDHVISFTNVPIITPNGGILIPSMNFKIVSGENVLVCGPNGCGFNFFFNLLICFIAVLTSFYPFGLIGKSSLFRFFLLLKNTSYFYIVICSLSFLLLFCFSLRILGGLWPLISGTITKPSSDKLFYIPQKPYLSLGTFRDQIIYPHSQSQVGLKERERRIFFFLFSLQSINLMVTVF